MDNKTRVSVFESELPAEIQMIKNKLKDAGIDSDTENSYLTFTTTPTATALRLMVSLQDEQHAFKIIDEYLQNQNSIKNGSV